MSNSPVPRSVLATLVGLALLLPLAQGVLFWVGRLLGAMQDVAGEALVGRIVLGLAALWLIDLALLVVALGVAGLGPPDDRGP